MKRLACPALLALALGLGGCGDQAQSNAPLRVSAVGARAAPGDPNSGPLDAARRALMGASAQGLVAFDAAGQIEPGLAESWIVIDDGRSYIFRIREAEWPDGTPVTTEQVARALKRAIGPNSRNMLHPWLKAIDDIVAMTDRVIEVRLSRPRPDLLKLFAQPELAVFRLDTMGGSGPYRIQPDPAGGALLTPALDPAHAEDDKPPKPNPADFIQLRGERAALGIARFKNGGADLVLGGTFADWPVVTAAQVPDAAIRIDPAVGLFGLAVVSRDGFLASADNRAALAMAIDRGGLTRLFRPDWAPVETMLPAQLDSAAAPTQPAWGTLAPDARRDLARSRVQAWQRARPGPVTIRVALPSGPGSNLVWASVGRALLDIGIRPVRVDYLAPADLRLIDAVAPYDSARWFLATACRLCDANVALAIEAARDAPTLDARAHRMAEAEAALAADSAYIPIAQPLRWAIVTSRITGWQGNARAWHPLRHLRNESE